MRAAVVGHVEWLEFVPVEAVPAAGRDRARVGVVGAGRRRRIGRRRAALEARRLRRLLHRARKRRARTARTRGAGGSGNHRSREHDRGATAQRLHAGRRRGRAHDRHDRSEAPPTRPRRGAPLARARTLRRRVLLRRGRRRSAHGAARARPRRHRAGAFDSQARLGRARCARVEREGRGRALPDGTARSGAAARRDDIGRTRRLGAARRPVHGGAASARAGRCVRRRRLLRRRSGIRARGRGWKGSRRSTSRRAAAPVPWQDPGVHAEVVRLS